MRKTIAVRSKKDITEQMEVFAKENVDKGLCEVVLIFDLLYEFLSADEIKNIAK